MALYESAACLRNLHWHTQPFLITVVSRMPLQSFKVLSQYVHKCQHLIVVRCAELKLAFQVRVGSLLDPKKMPGLAHFCEHMLFYASQKYPEEDAYSKFLVRS